MKEINVHACASAWQLIFTGTAQPALAALTVKLELNHRLYSSETPLPGKAKPCQSKLDGFEIPDRAAKYPNGSQPISLRHWDGI